jgi:hypothetical protein
MKAIIRLDFLRLFQQLVGQRVIRNNFETYDKDKLVSKDKM